MKRKNFNNQMVFNLIFMMIFFVASVSFSEKLDEYETLETLLQELRELRESKYELINQWRDEKQQLGLIKTMEEEKLGVLKKEKEATAQSLKDLKKKLKNEEEKNRVIDGKLTELKSWIEDSCQKFLNESAQNSILVNIETHDHITKIISDDKKTSEKLILFLNTLQNLAVDASKAQIRQEEVTLEGKVYSAEILQLGGVLEYLITPNHQYCAIRTSKNSQGQWRAMDASLGPLIRKGIQVVKKEIPAELVTLQVPIEGN